MNRARAALIAGALVVIAAVAFFLLANREGGGIFTQKCPLTGLEASDEKRIDRPAVAVKVENSPVAYPLAGLDRAEVVYEELVEGGITRFMAIYHCTDARKVGPVRSARIVDPAILKPIGRILADAGANQTVRAALEDAGIVEIDEDTAGGAMRRVPRPGISSEHTLYANTTAVRRIGSRRFDEAPGDLFEFGGLEGPARPATSITVDFGGADPVQYRWRGGKWLRIDGGEPLPMESGKNIRVENVLIEEHVVNLSKTIRDVAGNPSIEIADPTGSGRAALFRNGRVILGRWRRQSEDAPVSFETRAGERMVFAPGKIWVELVPNRRGDVKGSFSYAR